MSKLNQWLTLVANVSVVVGIVFLAMEMRQNTNAIQAQTFQDLMQQVNDYRNVLLDNLERYEIRERMQAEGEESLTRSERQMWVLPRQMIWGVYESAYFANERGVLGNREWIRFEDAICRNYRGDDDVSWSPNLLTPEFVDYVEGGCQ